MTATKKSDLSFMLNSSKQLCARKKISAKEVLSLVKRNLGKYDIKGGYKNGEKYPNSYLFVDEEFIFQFKEEPSYFYFLIEPSFLVKNIVKRRFYEELGIRLKIKTLSNEKFKETMKNGYIEMEQSIYAPDECRIKSIGEDCVFFHDYVEGMDIPPQKIQYKKGDMFFFKEPFLRDSEGKVQYINSPDSNLSQCEKAISLNASDIRLIGTIEDVEYFENRRHVKLTAKVKINAYK